MGEMTANGIAAVVLAVSHDSSAWGTRRFTVPISGVPALARVRRSLGEAGVRDVFLWTDEPEALAGLASWTRVVRLDAGESPASIVTSLDDRPLLFVCGDLALLTSATISAFLAAFLGSKAGRLADASGALAAFRHGETAAGALARAVAEFDDPAGPFGSGTWKAGDADDVRRLTEPSAFSALSLVAGSRVLSALGASGVLVVDPARTYVDEGVEIGEDTVIFPGTHVCGRSKIGSGCLIGPDSWIEASVIEDGVQIRYSVVEDARVRERSTVGPFAHLRRGSDIGPEARIGNFVEVKASRLGRGVKAGHLSYLGDAEVGEGSNVGAGAITCNYDGAEKHRTVIEDGVFIGTNVSLVAPVRIGRGAFLAAGSTITEDVPPKTMAFGRARQVVKERKADSSREGT